jgi:hypothetical protein
MLSPGTSASDYNTISTKFGNVWLLKAPSIDDAAYCCQSIYVFDNARYQIVVEHHHHASSFMKAFISAII